MEELAKEILDLLYKLAKLELDKKSSNLDISTFETERQKYHEAIIPLLEKAILFSPDDQTMRIVYNKIYCDDNDKDSFKCDFDKFELMRTSLVELSKAFGEAWSRKESTKLIEQFIKTYQVDTTGLVKTEFESLNDFFYREIDIEKYRPLEPEEKDDSKIIISSMADSHIMVFQPYKTIQELVVKNKVFTIESFLGGEETGFAKDMEDGIVACVRLHPKHIHRAYAPFDGVIGKPWYGGIAYHTTKPVGIYNPQIDTLGENKRVIIPLENKQLNLVVYLVFVGGPLIGSVEMTIKPGDQVKRGDELCYFAYGGSAIYMCFPKLANNTWIDWSVPINQHLDKSIEVQLRSTIGMLSFNQKVN